MAKAGCPRIDVSIGSLLTYSAGEFASAKSPIADLSLQMPIKCFVRFDQEGSPILNSGLLTEDADSKLIAAEAKLGLHSFRLGTIRFDRVECMVAFHRSKRCRWQRTLMVNSCSICSASFCFDRVPFVSIEVDTWLLVTGQSASRGR